jgi:hypothetical protein
VGEPVTHHHAITDFKKLESVPKITPRLFPPPPPHFGFLLLRCKDSLTPIKSGIHVRHGVISADNVILEMNYPILFFRQVSNVMQSFNIYA